MSGGWHLIKHGARLPIEPLVALVTPGVDPFARSSAQSRAWYRGRRTGYLTTYQGDRLATELGLHPFNVWGDQWIDPPTFTLTT